MATPWSVPRDLFAGRTVAVFASGPSLTKADCESCRDAGFATIAVNDAFKFAPWADMLHACDAKWWLFHAQEALNFEGVKVTLDDSLPFAAVNCLEWREGDGPSGVTTGYSDNPALIRTGGNSGYQAIHIAALGGAKRIIMLGFDMRAISGKSHFFGDHPLPLRNENDCWAKVFVPAFRTLAPELQSRGVEVINCTMGSAVDAFPIRPLIEVLG